MRWAAFSRSIPALLASLAAAFSAWLEADRALDENPILTTTTLKR
jgi:hypothetical protein